MSELKNIEKTLEQIWQDLHSCMNSLESGGVVDMALIDKKVKVFCDEIKLLQPDEAIKYKKKLPEIIEYLNNIVEKLQRQKDAVEKDFDGLGQRRRAHVAYGKTSVNNKIFNESD